jgi:hypothetical protein
LYSSMEMEKYLKEFIRINDKITITIKLGS